jgi:nitrate/TMAO reductase-like tetraheme cytochrome c subunit
MKIYKNLTRIVLSLGLIGLSHTIFADGHLSPIKIPEKIKAECASCHMVYQPGFLPKESWARMMSGLDKHYGVDASLDPQAVKEIGQWFSQHAGTYKRVSGSPPNDRITQSDWFVKKHRKINEKTWNNPKVKSKSNCMACHAGAEKGHYDDDGARVPQ